MPCYFKIILKSLILCICEGILKSFEGRECNSHTDLCKYICSVADCRNEWLCVYIYMLNAAYTSVVANTFLHMRFCMISLKCLQFDCQCSKKSSPKRDKQSLHCTTVTISWWEKLINLAGMLYLYLLFSKELSVACLEVIWKGMIKAILIFKIDFAYLISLNASPHELLFGLEQQQYMHLSGVSTVDPSLLRNILWIETSLW